LALVGPSHVSNTLLKRTPPYRLLEDFTAVAKIASMPNVIIASSQGRNSTVADLVKAATDRPGELNFGSVGMGSSSHLAVELFVHTVGIKATHVPYRTQATLISDLIGDRIQFYSAPLAAAMQLLQNKQAVALCVGARDRVALLPETPTMIELGYRDYTSDSWFGLIGPAGLDGSIVKLLNAELERTLADPAIRTTLASQGALPSYAGPGELIDLQRAELQRTSRILQFIDFKPE
jgi:tripartite-type tricarboxylate transporter receptor subunit TctC